MPAIAARPEVGDRFQTRRRRAQDDGALRELCSLDGDISGGIAQAILLVVGDVVLLINDDDNNNDETFNNRPQLEGNPKNPADLNSPETISIRHQQCIKVVWYLKMIGDYNDHYKKGITNEINIWDKLQENDPKKMTSRFSYNKEGKYVKSDH